MKFSSGHGHAHPKPRFVRKAWVKIVLKITKTVHEKKKKKKI